MAIATVVFVSIGLHEYAHAKVADMCGDPTPRAMGRVTLNLTKHFEPLGTIMIVLTSIAGFGIGWGKPVMVNPTRMRNPRWDHFWSVAAGPMTNLLLAAGFAILLRLGNFAGVIQGIPLEPAGQFATDLLFYGIVMNLGLAFFNLIPIGPLDGHWLVGAFMPFESRLRWYRFSQTYGSMLLLAVVLLAPGIISRVVGPPVFAAFRFLTGL